MPNNLKEIRLRFAPSPTGYLHIGSLRTVLFDFIIARKFGGKLILRIEDTDQKREVPGAVESLIKILDWVGIKFDEGPHVGGNFGPYTQSQRMDIYRRQADDLLSDGRAYRCFCSQERLKEVRERQQADKQAPRYDRHCRDLTEVEVRELINAGQKFVIRQKMPLNGKTVVRDLLRGDIKFENIDLEDQVLLKSDGFPTYQLASVVDDHLMKISHVLRGEEWLPSFPKNQLLYEAFGWNPPEFIHLPLTLNKGGGKLSKRQGDVAVEDYRAKGYLAEALINFCVLQGWHPPVLENSAEKKDEIYSLNEIISLFEIKDMGASPSVFDAEKLDFLNGYYIRHKSPEELADLCLPYLRDNLAKTENPRKQTREFIKSVILLEQERLKVLSEISELSEFLFLDRLQFDPAILPWKKMTAAEVKEKLGEASEVLKKIPEKNWTNDSIEEALKSHIEAKSGRTGEYLWPLRVALTGRKASPPPFDVAEALGKEECLGKIRQAIEML